MRTLLLVRHAEAAPTGPGGADADRPLTVAGRAAARDLGERLAARGRVDLAVVSTARRARESLDALVAGGLAVGATEPSALLLGASPLSLLDVVREAPDDAGTVLLVGHAPGLPALVDLLLADGTGSDADRSTLARGLAPGTAVLVGVDRPWADLDPRQADLLTVLGPAPETPRSSST